MLRRRLVLLLRDVVPVYDYALGFVILGFPK